MLSIGVVLKAATEAAELFEGYVRFVGISRDDDAWLMQLDVYQRQKGSNKKIHFDFENLKAPFRVSLRELRDAVEQGRVFANLEFDCGIPASEEQLSSSAHAKMEQNYALIEPLLKEEALLYDPRYRSRAILDRAEACGVSDRNLKRLYYRYLWGGMVKMSLAAAFKNCGNPGELQKAGQGRRGRKSECEVPLPVVRDALEKGAKKYYLSGCHTLLEAYVETLKERFPAGFKLTEDIDGSKKLNELILPPPVRPTFAQFRGVCEYLERKEGKRSKRPRHVRDKEEPWSFRGNNRQGVHGPGARFEIDATKLQVQLVSRYGRRHLVGTPTFYSIMDVWSGVCVGYTLSLENAGWALAAKALHNTFQEKSILFKRLGLPFSDEDWPCHHLSSRITADRAELVSNKSVVPEIGIKIEIMPPMCPELKGLVEGAINEIKHGRSQRIPGSYPKMPRRREPDGKDDACLTVDQLEVIIVRQIMKLNNAPLPLKNIPHQLLQSGETDITRLGLYKWGLRNCPGFTRTLTRKEVYTNLLSKETASVTPRGISFKGQIYFADELAQGYLRRAANGNFPIEIRYDEHLADQIWFLDEGSNDWVAALVNNDDIRRLKVAFFELESFYKDAKKLILDAKMENAHQGLESQKEDAPMIRDAIQRTKVAKKGISRTEGKSKIRRNREVERDANRLIEGRRVIDSYTEAIKAAKTTSGVVEQDEDFTQDETRPVKPRSIDLWRRLNGRCDHEKP